MTSCKKEYIIFTLTNYPADKQIQYLLGVHLQVEFWMADPEQGDPPLIGTGFVQDLDLTWVPFLLPVVQTLQQVNDPHADQPPSEKVS